jgi:hypothetical protein
VRNLTAGLAGSFVNGRDSVEAFYRNKIMSNAVPSAVHAITSVAQKTRIANWSFESSSMMVKSIAEEWDF